MSSNVDKVLQDSGELPPNDILVSLKKTATFVARLGITFENKMKEKEKNNPKFCFLKKDDPWHELYIKLINAGKRDEAVKSGTIEVLEKEEEMKELSAKAGALMVQQKKELELSALLGSRMGDSAVIKPTVFTQEEIVERAKKAPPSLVQQILRARKRLADEGWSDKSITGYNPNQFVLSFPDLPLEAADLDLMKWTAQFVAKNGQQIQTKLAQREAHNPQFDFLKSNHPFYPLYMRLVETYTLVVLPPKDVQGVLNKNFGDRHRLLEEIISRHELQSKREEDRRLEKEKQEQEKKALSAIDWSDFVVVDTIDFAAKPKEPANPSAPKPPPPKPTTSTAAPPQGKPTPAPAPPKEPVRTIVADFSRPKPATVRSQLCPKCGDPIPIDEIDVHIKKCIGVKKKVVTEDPRPAVGVAEGEIGDHLKHFAKFRSDIFDVEPAPPKIPPPSSTPASSTPASSIPPTPVAPVPVQTPVIPPQTKPPNPNPVHIQPPTSTNIQPPTTTNLLPPTGKPAQSLFPNSDFLATAKKAKVEPDETETDYITVQVKLPETDQEKGWNFDQKVLSLSCYLSDTFKSIKEKLKNSTNVPPSRQILGGFGQKVLANTQTLGQFTKVEEGSVEITLSVKKK